MPPLLVGDTVIFLMEQKQRLPIDLLIAFTKGQFLAAYK